MDASRWFFLLAMLCLALLGLDLWFTIVNWPEERNANCKLGYSDTPSRRRDGVDSMVASLSFQIATMVMLVFFFVRYTIQSLMSLEAYLSGEHSLYRHRRTIEWRYSHDGFGWDREALVLFIGLNLLTVVASICYGISGGCNQTTKPQTVLQYPPPIAIALTLAIYLVLILIYLPPCVYHIWCRRKNNPTSPKGDQMV